VCVVCRGVGGVIFNRHWSREVFHVVAARELPP